MSEDPIRFKHDHTGSNQRPQSEVYREAYERWVAADAAARLLDETKSSVFAQRVLEAMRSAPGVSMSKAEIEVRASAEWRDYLIKMTNAKTAANKAKIEVEFHRMKYWEATQDRADHRYEARMS
jgi:hypothetical protein